MVYHRMDHATSDISWLLIGHFTPSMVHYSSEYAVCHIFSIRGSIFVQLSLVWGYHALHHVISAISQYLIRHFAQSLLQNSSDYDVGAPLPMGGGLVGWKCSIFWKLCLFLGCHVQHHDKSAESCLIQ